MLAIQMVLRALCRDVGRLPILTRAGLALALVTFAADVLIHLSPAPIHHHGGFRPEEHLAHLAGLVAMAIALLGVVIDGARKQRSQRRRSGARGEPRHADR